MTLQKLLLEGSACLKEAGIAEADLDARYLLMAAYGLSATDFLMKRNLEQDLDVGAYQEMITRRSRRVPLQYVLGTQEFMGLEFFVDERVLIPRQDTEDMVELILREHPDRDCRMLDMCTGSGCIGISLAKLGGYAQVTAADISEGALQVARANAKNLGVEERLRFVHSDMYARAELFEAHGYDVIVSNPPYIPTKVIAGLQPEVRDFEPLLALDGTEDGLAFYRILANESGRFLRPGGSLCLEIGYDQGSAVSRLLKEAGYIDVTVIKDTPGLDRIVKGKYIGGSHV